MVLHLNTARLLAQVTLHLMLRHRLIPLHTITYLRMPHLHTLHQIHMLNSQDLLQLFLSSMHLLLKHRQLTRLGH